MMKRAAALMRERVETIARIATMEEGKTLAETRIRETQSRRQPVRILWRGVRGALTARVLVRPAGRRSLVIKEPVGPVAAFAPWNFPITNPARKLGGPIAAGCSVILKPAEEAPGAALEVLRALIDAGLPAGVAQVVFGVPDEVSRHLLASPVIRKLSFTGSIAVGKHLMKLAADNMLRTTMELGGHAPVLIFDDADLDKAMDELTAAKLRNAGQVCISPTRFYVQEGVYDRFVRGLTERLEKVSVGDGLAETSRMGPMANPRRPETMERMIADAVANGARVRTGGERLGNAGFFWRPTVISDVTDAAQIMNDEPFGPVAVIAPVKGLDEAIVQANRLPYGLAAYAYTQDAKRILLLGDAIETGMLGLNTAMVAAPDSPFGGVKESGHGAEDGPEGLDACLVTKAIHQG